MHSNFSKSMLNPPLKHFLAHFIPREPSPISMQKKYMHKRSADICLMISLQILTFVLQFVYKENIESVCVPMCLRLCVNI